MAATRLLRVLVPASAVALAFVAIASAGWAGSDPAKNLPVRKLPLACQTDPAGEECVNAGVYYLDKARAKLGEHAYALPADFPSLGPARQMFILTNLDRIAYDLPPITGLTDALNHDAYVTGIKQESDPLPSDPTGEINEWTSNWAGGFENAPLAYEAWMYDDGLGSSNVDCTPSYRSACWGHRHDILWKFATSDVLAMGAASRRGLDGPSYALLVVAGFPADPSWDDPGYTPTYAYTWSDAVADGAGTNAYDPGVPDTAVCHAPSTVGRKLGTAKKLIVAAHCSLGRVVHKSAAYPKGFVLAQTPQSGRVLASGARLGLTVSSGTRRR